MIAPVTFPRVGGTTATYLHPLLQASVLQSARPATFTLGVEQPAPVRPEPSVPAVSAVDRTAAYAAGLVRDATTAVNAANATARTAPTAVDPATELAREIVLDRTSSQLGMLLTRAAGERRVALSSGVPATRLVEINTSTSRLYHALDVLA